MPKTKTAPSVTGHAIDLKVYRTPSNVRNMLEARVRRLAGSKPRQVRMQALKEIRDIADAHLHQMMEE